MISKALPIIISTLGCAFLAIALAPGGSPFEFRKPLEFPEPVVQRDAEPDALSPEQARLAEHLAAKYSKPLELVQTAVRSAWREAQVHNLSPLLVLAIIETESGFRHQVVNTYGAMGLMQVVPRWHPEKLSPFEESSQLLNPEVNIRVGTQILAEYLERKNGNLPRALAKYSGGASSYYEKVQRHKRVLQQKLKTAADAEA